MTAEYQFFIDVLADHIHERKTEIPQQELDWKRILELADEQGLGGILWYQCREGLKEKPQLLGRLHNYFTSDVFFDVCRRRDMSEVTKAYAEEDIRFVPVKGMILSKYYPVPQLRTMGDIDMVIKTEDRRKTDDIMIRLGFEKKVDNHAVWTYSRDVVTYEIHDHMMYEPLANTFDYQTYFDRIWEHAVLSHEGGYCTLQTEFHFLYLIAHTAKHLTNKGSGMRPFLDMVFMARQEDENMDWKLIESELRKLCLFEFAKTCFALCGRWFKVEMPFQSDIDERFYREATQKVLKDGIFGLENEENQTGGSAKTIRRSLMPYWMTAVMMTWKKIFPPYRDMQLIPWYSFVDGKPWLLPVAWIYRWWYCARNKWNHSKQLLSEPFVKREEICRREKLIDS